MKPSEEEFVKNQEVHYWWHAHSDLSALSMEALSDQIRTALMATKAFMEKSEWLIITPGTAWVYELKDDQIVANCHKQPNSTFRKRLLTPEEITASWESLYEEIKKQRPDLRILWTISPVRHVRDGLKENNESKGILHLAVKEIVKANENCFYFPSYEIMIDVLRDYRFYHKDRIHPNEEAIGYIFDQFGNTFFDEGTQEMMKEWTQLKKALNHRSFHPETDAHQKFLRATISRLEQLGNQLDVDQEIETLKKQLIA